MLTPTSITVSSLLLALVASGCDWHEYCSSDLGTCVQPTGEFCVTDPTACNGTLCDNVTGLCVIDRIECELEAGCTVGEYCSPYTQMCSRPTNPGVKCDHGHPCNGTDVCDPVTMECVAQSVGCQAPNAGCNASTYCDKQSKACQTPTNTTCHNDADCTAAAQICSSLTKLCVTNGDNCIAICPADSYCSPMLKRCAKPLDADNSLLCNSSAQCGIGAVCCPLTRRCSTLGDSCFP